MHALITGANGFIGSALARRLWVRGDRIRCLDRAGADRSLLEGLTAEHLVGDVTDPATLPKAFEGVDVVFHLAGLRRSPSREAFFAVNAEGTRHVLEAAAAQPKPPRVMVMSSIAAVGPSREHPDEDAPLKPYDWYGESKAEAERIAREYAAKVPIVIARPSRILGPGDRENLAFIKLVQKGFKLTLGGGPRPMSTIDVDDVVEALLRLGEHERAVGEAFFVSRDTTTMEAVQDQVADALAKRPRTVHLPAALFSGLAAGADLFSRATGKHLPLNRKLAQQMLVPGWTCSTKKAKERLGWEARIPMADSIGRSVRWYREQGWI